MEFDWQIGHSKPWLKIREVRDTLRCSEEHISNLIADKSLDTVIDIRADGATRPAYRVFREALFRFLRRADNPPATDLETALNPYLNAVSLVFSAWQAAEHLRCTDTHILNLAHHFTDIRAAQAERRCLRIHRSQLLRFIHKRRIQ